MDALSTQLDTTDEKAAVYAVVVSYHPDVRRISALFASLRTQVAGIVVVDNGSTGDALALLRQQATSGALKLIEFGENKGIATAHNAGIRHALDSGATHVMLFDHDSILEDGCVAQLLRANRRLAASGVRVGAVGPQYHDDTSAARAPYFRFRSLRFARVYAQNDDDMVEANVLISSGCLISREILAEVGWMDEALFIEGVDWEWCMRASSHGYRLFGIAAAKMQHSLGDSGIRVFGRILPLHSVLRHYYVFRNTVLMNRMPHVATVWKWNFSLRLAIRFFIYLFFAPHRIERCRMIGRGIVDGLHGRSGPFRVNWQDGADKPVSVR
jgi:rhamnosyltransferase